MSFAIHFRGTFTSRLLTRLLLHINRCPTWAFPPLDRTLRRPANSTYSAWPPRSGLRRIDIYSKDSSSASALRLSAPPQRSAIPHQRLEAYRLPSKPTFPFPVVPHMQKPFQSSTQYVVSVGTSTAITAQTPRSLGIFFATSDSYRLILRTPLTTSLVQGFRWKT